MAGTDGHPDPDLTHPPVAAVAPETLPVALAIPGAAGGDATALRAGLFETVRLLATAAGGGPTPIGGDLPPGAEPVRLVAAEGFRHPDAEVLDTARDGGEGSSGPVTLSVGFMGLTGPSGVLPDHYTEAVLSRGRARDVAMQRFLDLFNHRAISLFYRAWAKYRLPVQFAETGGDLSDPFSRALAAVAGLPRPDGDPRQLGGAGAMARRVRTPSSLRRMLALRFDLPVEVMELRPRRIRISADQRTVIGAPGGGRGRFATLGGTAVLGERVVDVAGRFRLRVGPLDRARFLSFFAADGPRRALGEAVRLATGATADFDLQLVLRRTDVGPSRIGAGDAVARLGQTSWLISGPATRDRDDAVLSGPALR